MKNTWFKHDDNAHDDPKLVDLLQEFGLEGVGAFWMICELMHQNATAMLSHSRRNAIAFQLHTDSDKLAKIIDFCVDTGLFESDGKNFWSIRLQRDREQLDKISEANSRNAKTRWASEENAIALRSSANKNKKENKKEKRHISERLPLSEEGPSGSGLEGGEPDSTINDDETDQEPTNLKTDYRDQSVDEILNALTDYLGIHAFVDDKKWIRIYGKNLSRLREKLGEYEFWRRVDVLRDDDFHMKNVSKIRHLYNELKAVPPDTVNAMRLRLGYLKAGDEPEDPTLPNVLDAIKVGKDRMKSLGLWELYEDSCYNGMDIERAEGRLKQAGTKEFLEKLDQEIARLGRSLDVPLIQPNTPGKEYAVGLYPRNKICQVNQETGLAQVLQNVPAQKTAVTTQ